MEAQRLRRAAGRHAPQELEAYCGPRSTPWTCCIVCSAAWEPEFPGSDLNFAGWAKKLTGAPAITVGSVASAASSTWPSYAMAPRPHRWMSWCAALTAATSTWRAVGRALLMDPQWVEKVREGRTGELFGFDKAALARLW